MCGIIGVLSKVPGNIRSRVAVEQGVSKLVHRGPDDLGIYANSDESCVLGQTRLSILDLSAAGHQPMSTPDKRFWIVFNGEIYNFKQLRQQLEQSGETFTSQSDTEVILRLYALKGPDCLHDLRGMFAFAIWDTQQRQLFIARDRLGIKPLYFYRGEGRFVFASEVRAILATGLMPRQIDPTALNEYLTYQSIPAPKTIIKGISTLLPGTWIRIDEFGQLVEHQYWDLLKNKSIEARSASKAETIKRVGELLREAVEQHLISDVPVGVFLSGGIDSSAIVGLINEMGQTSRTFSVIFAESNFDESVYAQQVADRFHTEHTEIHLTDDQMLSQLPEALAAMDQPTGDGINSYVVSQAVRSSGIKVALSGLGGDEFFIGYPSFFRLEKALKYLHSRAYLPAPARNLLARAVEMTAGKSIQVSKAAAMISSNGSLEAMYPITRQVLSMSRRHLLLSERWRQLSQEWQDPYVALLKSAYQSASGAELLTQISYAEARTYMHDVLLRDSDQMSMAHGLEVRVPLLDHKLVEYMMGVPDEYKRPNGTPKSLLIASLGNLLPREVVHRPKQGFTLPFANWMRGDLQTFCEKRLDRQRINSRGIFDAGEVHRLWKSFLSGSTEVSWSRLWVLVVLEDWLEQNQVQCSI